MSEMISCHTGGDGHGCLAVREGERCVYELLTFGLHQQGGSRLPAYETTPLTYIAVNAIYFWPCHGFMLQYVLQLNIHPAHLITSTSLQSRLSRRTRLSHR